MADCAGDDRKSDENTVGSGVSDEWETKMKFLHEIDGQHPPICSDTNLQNESDNREENQDEDDSEEDDEEEEDGAEPIGEIIRVSEDGGEKRNHFGSFEFNGGIYNLEDSVLVTPEKGKLNPSVVIIKDIFQVESGGNLQVLGQRFYRPWEAEKKEGGTWDALVCDDREFFCSSYLDQYDACTVMHPCVIHLLFRGEPFPDRKQNPGLVVRKFYDIRTKKIRNLAETDC